MIIYGLKNCDTCRKATKAFPQMELIDVRQVGVPDDVLRRAIDTFGPALVNTRSTTWRGLGPEEREQPAYDLLIAHPTLMKRPLIAVDDTLFLSWNKQIEDDIKALL